jgi:hypothetical protein
MNRRTPSVVLSSIALFASVGGGAAVAATGWSGSQHQVKDLIAHSTAYNARHLGGQPAGYYLAAKHFVSSGGEHFFSPGQSVTLGRAGHFTFTASCTNATDGSQEVSFNVVSNSTADVDGTGPAPAGNRVVIHKDSDAEDSTADAPLKPGDFTQVGSASSSTEIAADGQEVDVFYNDGVNWPATGSSPAHACSAGYTGFLG